LEDRRACIEIGSNCVRFLAIAVPGPAGRPYATLEDGRVFTHLGRGLPRGGRLGSAAAGETAEAVLGFAARARELGCRTVVGVGTQALRRASDGPTFLEAVGLRAGVLFRVLGPDEESVWTYRGVRGGHREIEGPIVTLDVGGGSTELASGAGADPLEVMSLPIGTQPVLRRFSLDRSPSPSLLRGAVRWSGERAAAVRNLAGDRAPVWATGGTAVALGWLRVGLRRYEPDRIEGTGIEASQLERLLLQISRWSEGYRNRRLTIDPQRAEQILAGGAVILAVLQSLRARSLRVTIHDLRLGLLLEGGRSRP
jgi:exopolyphosphatase/guanosine-5'-triphosphate,3'-diphosphate pyrophosphatase